MSKVVKNPRFPKHNKWVSGRLGTSFYSKEAWDAAHTLAQLDKEYDALRYPPKKGIMARATQQEIDKKKEEVETAYQLASSIMASDMKKEHFRVHAAYTNYVHDLPAEKCALLLKEIVDYIGREGTLTSPEATDLYRYISSRTIPEKYK